MCIYHLPDRDLTCSAVFEGLAHHHAASSWTQADVPWPMSLFRSSTKAKEKDGKESTGKAAGKKVAGKKDLAQIQLEHQERMRALGGGGGPSSASNGQRHHNDSMTLKSDSFPEAGGVLTLGVAIPSTGGIGYASPSLAGQGSIGTPNIASGSASIGRSAQSSARRMTIDEIAKNMSTTSRHDHDKVCLLSSQCQSTAGMLNHQFEI